MIAMVFLTLFLQSPQPAALVSVQDVMGVMDLAGLEVFDCQDGGRQGLIKRVAASADFYRIHIADGMAAIVDIPFDPDPSMTELCVKLSVEQQAALRSAKQALRGSTRGSQDKVSASVLQKDSDETIVLRILFENRLSKSIKGFKGVFSVRDLFGDPVAHLSLKQYQRLSPGEAKTVRVELEPDPEQRVALSELPLEDLQFAWDVTNIVFDDGTSWSK